MIELQQTRSICENCNDRLATTSCEVCGSQVCGECRLEYGCKVCNGGEKTFE